MKISMYESYVVTYWGEWIGTSLHSDEIYTTENEANEAMKKAMENTAMIQANFKYKVQTLSDYMRDMREEARWEGERNQIDRQSY